MKSFLKVSIVIVNWNGRKWLDDNVKSLKKLKYQNFEVIFVDNGSEDESVAYMKNNLPGVRIIKNSKNLGFVGGNNIGYKKAKGEYLLLLNNDTVVSPNLLAPLVNLMDKDQSVGVIQPKIIFYNSKLLQAGGSFLTYTGFLYHSGFTRDPSDPKFNRVTEVFSANGACMMVRKSVIDKIGLFDKDFFSYFEESDFCWRVWLSGYKVVYYPQVTVLHKGSQTSVRFGSGFVQYHSFKNRICSLIKNLGFKGLLTILPIHLIICFFLSLTFLIFGQFSRFLSIQKAILWNLINLKKTLEKRKIIQRKMRKISDKIIYEKLISSPSYHYFLFFFRGLKNSRG